MFFRKSKIDDELPKPPTKAEILEDLQTFSVEHLRNHDLQRRSPEASQSPADLSASLNATEPLKTPKPEDDNGLAEWWDMFEKFLGDVDKLEAYQKEFDVKRQNLEELDRSVKQMVDDIQTQLRDGLDKVREELGEEPVDLK